MRRFALAAFLLLTATLTTAGPTTPAAAAPGSCPYNYPWLAASPNPPFTSPDTVEVVQKPNGVCVYYYPTVLGMGVVWAQNGEAIGIWYNPADNRTTVDPATGAFVQAGLSVCHYHVHHPDAVNTTDKANAWYRSCVYNPSVDADVVPSTSVGSWANGSVGNNVGPCLSTEMSGKYPYLALVSSIPFTGDLNDMPLLAGLRQACVYEGGMASGGVALTGKEASLGIQHAVCIVLDPGYECFAVRTYTYTDARGTVPRVQVVTSACQVYFDPPPCLVYQDRWLPS